MTSATMGSDGRARLSAVILTRNEEALIERCLRSVRDVVDDIIVVDSCSTDGTCEIATRMGARVVEQPWLGWIRQRALGIHLAQHDWVLIVEADEIVTPRLATSIREALASPLDPADGFSIDRRDDFLGALLPSMRRRKKQKSFVRLFNRTRSAYDPTLVIHDEVRVAGRTAPLDGILIHWRGFTIVQQVARYTHYAPLEADVMEARGDRVSVASLAWRPFLRFGWCYLACGGFRLGARGFAHALMVASSEYLRFAAVWERQQAPASMHPSTDVGRAYLYEEAPAETRVSTPTPVSRGIA
ncbi:MAG: glycosyltransferase family 2 protein [Gemmatimonadota bacterium]